EKKQQAQDGKAAKAAEKKQQTQAAKTDKAAEDQQNAVNSPLNGSSSTPAQTEAEESSEIADLVYDSSWPPPQNRPRTVSTFWQRIPSMLMFLVLVCALIWISLRIIAPFSEKLTGNTAPKKQINVIERKSLGPNKAVVLLEVAEKRLLLGITEKTISTLAELECPPPPENSDDTDTDKKDKTDKTDQKNSPPRDLVKEVIAKHLASLPSLK
ncbi:MAG: flagellar biosynthetic protein FliO, partial [bacterium]|nr:flagellar biosynthetic protein FliO [bacterium]